MLDSIARESLGLLGADRCAILHLDEATRSFEYLAHSGLSKTYRETSIGGANRHYARMSRLAKDLLQRKDFFVSDVLQEPCLKPIRNFMLREGFRSAAVFPLRSGRKVLGALIFYHNQVRTYSQSDRQLGRAFASHAAITILHAKLYEEAKEAGDFLKGVIESAGDAIVTADKRRRITYWNRAAEALYEYKKKEVLGKPVSLWYPPHRGKKRKALVEKIKKGKAVRDFETQRMKKDGTLVDVSLTLSSLKDPQGHLLGAIGISKDITERKRSEAELAKAQEENIRLYREAKEAGDYLNSLVEDAGDAIVALDEQKRVISWNNAAEALYGYKSEEVLGKSISFLIPPNQKGELKWIPERVRKGETIRDHETQRMAKNGKPVDVSITFSPIQDAQGHFMGFSTIAKDITERKRIQELERRQAVSEKLAATGRMAARIAHEINNPLAGIKSSFELIKSTVHEDHPYYEYAGRVEKEIERIARIVHQMYDLYRPEQEKDREVDLNQKIRDVVALMESSFRGEKVSVTVDLPKTSVITYLREDSLSQVMLNLLQNALDASSPGDEVKVVTIPANNHIQVSVIDQGCGIPKSVRPQIFEPFFTTKGDSSKGQIGLGLSISRSLAEAMGASLDFQSQVGQGTTFQLALPRQRSPRRSKDE